MEKNWEEIALFGVLLSLAVLGIQYAIDAVTGWMLAAKFTKTEPKTWETVKEARVFRPRHPNCRCSIIDSKSKANSNYGEHNPLPVSASILMSNSIFLELKSLRECQQADEKIIQEQSRAVAQLNSEVETLRKRIPPPQEPFRLPIEMANLHASMIELRDSLEELREQTERLKGQYDKLARRVYSL